MIIKCQSCGHRLDDAEQSTICPHDRFLSIEDQAQKDLGISLLGKKVAFHHMPESPVRITSVGWNGMVSVEGMAGEFAPSLFRRVE